MGYGIVGDAYHQKEMLRTITHRKLSMQTSQQQLMSGQRHTKPREFRENIMFIRKLQQESEQQANFIHQNKTMVKVRLEVEQSILKRIQEQAIEFKVSLASFNDGTSQDPLPFLNDFQSYMTVIQQAGNTMLNGDYLLGGTITNFPPFNLDGIPNGLPPSSGVNMDYYNGNTSVKNVNIDTVSTLTFDLNGGNSTFENLIRSLKIATNPNITSGDITVNTAQSLLDSALDGLNLLLTKATFNIENIDRLIDYQEQNKLYLDNKRASLVDVDPEEAITQFNNNQRILEMAYQSIGQSSKLSLTDYLK